MDKTISALFDTLVTGGSDATQIYKPLIANYGKYGEQLASAYSELGLTLEQQRPIDEIIMDISYMSEQHGFEQGLKLGFKMAAFSLVDAD